MAEQRRGLFGEDEKWGEEANKCWREVHSAVSPIVRKWAIEKGFKVRDIENVGYSAVLEACLDVLLDEERARRNKEK